MIIRLIKSSALRRDWVLHGGDIATVDERSGALVVPVGVVDRPGDTIGPTTVTDGSGESGVTCRDADVEGSEG